MESAPESLGQCPEFSGKEFELKRTLGMAKAISIARAAYGTGR
jgi:hypothetical protein